VRLYLSLNLLLQVEMKFFQGSRKDARPLLVRKESRAIGDSSPPGTGHALL